MMRSRRKVKKPKALFKKYGLNRLAPPLPAYPDSI
jgi:hypothetical protein